MPPAEPAPAPAPPPDVAARRTYGALVPTRALGAGEDGFAFLADGGDGPVVIHDLTRARRDPARWARIGLALAQRRLIQDPCLLPLLEANLDGARPYLVTATLQRLLFERLPLEPAEAAAVGFAITRAVLLCHQRGLVLGGVDPQRVGLGGAGTVLLDPLPLDTWKRPSSALVDACHPPGERESRAYDLYGLCTLLAALTTGVAPAASIEGPFSGLPLRLLLQQGRRPDPDERPAAGQLLSALGEVVEGVGTVDADPIAVTIDPTPARPTSTDELRQVIEAGGRYRLGRALGMGSMGSVFEAEDRVSGRSVALKVLGGSSTAVSERSRRRFCKEARLLSEIQSPYIANLLDVQLDGAVQFIALELVEGEDLHQVVARHGPLSEAVALRIVADIARGLLDAHLAGIVHRDLKPGNMLLRSGIHLDEVPGHPSPVACLVDFGIARHVEESASLALTRDGGIVGTPMYLSPEQAGAGDVVPASDVYSLGATLFHLLTGGPPFDGGGAFAVVAKHLNQVPPTLAERGARVSPGTEALVARMLAKSPAGRPADAAVLLVELERLIGAELPVGIEEHPLLPDDEGVVTQVLEFDLASEPAALWPYVSDTDRLNRGVGLGKLEVEHRPVGDDVHQYVRMPMGPLQLVWREHPFEWIENRRFGVFRELSEGPVFWLRSVVDLLPGRDGRGTHLVHRFDLAPRPGMEQALAALQQAIGGFERAYRRIDRLLEARPSDVVDVFEEAVALGPEAERRLRAGERKLVAEGCDPAVVEKLGRFLEHGNLKDVSHIRPLAFARRFRLDEESTLKALFSAVSVGLLTLHWDLICPTCRIASDIGETLAMLKSHGHCAACNLDYALDLATSVELVLRVHARVREPEVATYCASSPGHSPHVRARVRVAPGERMKLELNLDDGRYALAGRGVACAIDFSVRSDGATHRFDLDVAARPPPGMIRTLRSTAQQIVLVNTGETERVVRVESVAERGDAFTAAHAAAHALFRQLFPDERMADGQLVSIRHIALGVVELADADALWSRRSDDEVYARLSALFVALQAHVAERGGAVVKLRQEGALVAFSDCAAAVAALLDLQQVAREARLDEGVALKAAVHQGAARGVSLNGRLDFFGSLVRGAEALLRSGGRRELVVSQEVATDPAVARLLEGAETEIVGVPTGGFGLRRGLR